MNEVEYYKKKDINLYIKVRDIIVASCEQQNVIISVFVQYNKNRNNKMRERSKETKIKMGRTYTIICVFTQVHIIYGCMIQGSYEVV